VTESRLEEESRFKKGQGKIERQKTSNRGAQEQPVEKIDHWFRTEGIGKSARKDTRQGGKKKERKGRANIRCNRLGKPTAKRR